MAFTPEEQIAALTNTINNLVADIDALKKKGDDGAASKIAELRTELDDAKKELVALKKIKTKEERGPSGKGGKSEEETETPEAEESCAGGWW